MAFLAANLGGIVQAGFSIVSVFAGPLLGVFMMGLAVPFVNKTGAFVGLLTGWVRE